MEKIYMEDNNNKQTRRGLVDFSVILSFTVAIFAIFSITMFGIVSFQGTNVSYAAPLDDNTQFTFMHANPTDNPDSADAVISYNADETKAFRVPIYLAGSASNFSHFVFCIERNVHAPSTGTNVLRDDLITDYGLLYLLTNSYANGRPRTNITDETNKKYVEAYITQVAIWMYMFETQPNVIKNGVMGNYNSPTDDEDNHGSNPTTDVQVHLITNTELNTIKTAQKLYLQSGNNNAVPLISNVNIYETYIKPLVEEAKAASGQKQFYFTYNEEESATISEDKKFYYSPLISAIGTPSDDLRTFDVSLSGIDGATVVDKDKQPIERFGIPAGKSFYIRIPVEKAPGEGKEANVYIQGVGHFDGVTGYFYVASDNGNALQRIVTITGTTNDATADKVIKFIGGGDTGMNTAQTIYFIGLIVLLCGVGIIYANAKPVEVEQQ